MAKPLKKRPIEKELKFLANFELYGVLMFTGMYFAAKYIVKIDLDTFYWNRKTFTITEGY